MSPYADAPSSSINGVSLSSGQLKSTGNFPMASTFSLTKNRKHFMAFFRQAQCSGVPHTVATSKILGIRNLSKYHSKTSTASASAA
jgi:hypothetical protein